MKNLQTFQEFVNESRINEAFVGKTDMQLLQDTYNDYIPQAEDYGMDMSVLKKGYETIAKLLKGNMKNVCSDMEEGEYELCKALAIGLDKRATGKFGYPIDPNISVAGSETVNSAFTDGPISHVVTLYHIKDIDIHVVTWVDGDDYAEFDHIACLKKDEKKLVAWVNKNMSEDDMGY
jgi:hypothetical protein